MISIKEFIQIIKNSKNVKYLGSKAKEVYNNEKTGVRLILNIFNDNDDYDEKYITLVNIVTPDHYGNRDIVVDDDLQDEFIKWALINEYFEEWDEKHEYYENEHDFYDVDYVNMDFKDELVQKFYEDNKEDILFFHPLLPLDIHQEVMSCNQDEGWFYEKHLETELVLKIYEHLVNNKL